MSACNVTGFATYFRDIFHLGDVLVIDFGDAPHFFPATAGRRGAVTGRERFPFPRGASRRLTASSAAIRTSSARDLAVHRDDSLFLDSIQYLSRAGTLLFEKRRTQTALLVTTADVADGLRSQWDDAGKPWRDGFFHQLRQRQGAEDDRNC
jgi:hypothetical protein